MALHFTKQQIDEIEQALIARSKKDSSFPGVDVLDGNDLIPIVQNGVNKTIMYSSMLDRMTEALVTAESIESALGYVPADNDDILRIVTTNGVEERDDVANASFAFVTGSHNISGTLYYYEALLPKSSNESASDIFVFNGIANAVDNNGDESGPLIITATYDGGDWDIVVKELLGDYIIDTSVLSSQRVSGALAVRVSGTYNLYTYDAILGKASFDDDAGSSIYLFSGLVVGKMANTGSLGRRLLMVTAVYDHTHGSWSVTCEPAITSNDLSGLHSTIINELMPSISAKYTLPSTGIPASDIAEGVIPDVSQFVTKSVSDLANYYLKSDTYTKEEVLALIAGIGQFVYVVADILPSASADTMGKIYLIPSSDPQVQNIKDEFITIENNGVYSWEQIGSTTIDLSGYVTTQELNAALANYTTSAELTTLLAAKYEKPSAGIPKSDLSSSAQSSLGKADTAYQKPSTGIPATDMTASVRESLELANSSVTLNEYTISYQGLLLDVSGNSYLVRIGYGTTDAVYLISCEDDYTNTRVNELTSYDDLEIGFYLCPPGKLLFWASSTTKFSIISLRENGAIDAEIVDEIPVDAEHIAPARYATDSDLALKQDIISDLSTIRSGAAAGASAVQPSAIANMESTNNKTTSLSSASTDQQYPSAKAVYDSFYKRGVVSQTQTWKQAADGGWDYVMSNLIYGDIPRANIDLYEAAGAVFNATTGYFELNGLTDISYEEMSAIYSVFVPNPWTNQQGMFTYIGIRTNLPPNSNIAEITGFNGLRLAYGSDKIERIALKNGTTSYPIQLSSFQLAFFNLFHITHVIGNIAADNATNFGQAFKNCSSLREIRIRGVKAALSFSESSRLSKDSLLYIINNASTTAFTITLHADVYAKCQSGGEWYSDISTALEAHTNVSLASA